LANIRQKVISGVFILCSLVIALIAVWQVKNATPYGLGLYNDSVQYIFGARNLVAGNGFTRISGGGELKPLTTVPPLFSMAIALVSLSGLEALRAARLLILGLLGLDIILWGCLVWQITRSRLSSLIGVLLFATTNIIFNVFTKLMSEPLFILIWLLSFLIYAQYLSSRRTVWLIILGVACGGAYLTRYIGIAFFATFTLCLLLFEPGWKKKLSSIFWVGLACLPIIAGWSIRNGLLIGNPVNRTFIYHPVNVDYFSFAIDSFWDWVMPNEANGLLDLYVAPLRVVFILVFILSLVLLIIKLLAYLKNRRVNPSIRVDPPQTTLLFALGIHTVVYLLLNIIAVSFVDASTLLDHRLLLPVYFSLWILILAGLTVFYKRSGSTKRILLIIMVVAALGVNSRDGWQVINDGRNSEGFGYAALSLQLSPSTLYIKDLPQTIFYTNKAYMFYIITDRNAYQAAPMVDSVSRELREDFLSNLKEMKMAILEGKALFVYYREPDYLTDIWYQTVTEGLTVVKEFPDAIIFGKGE
jgi:4-amino-4-deoxy-L-arabinose transferase-like glycosyltransferase